MIYFQFLGVDKEFAKNLLELASSVNNLEFLTQFSEFVKSQKRKEQQKAHSTEKPNAPTNPQVCGKPNIYLIDPKRSKKWINKVVKKAKVKSKSKSKGSSTWSRFSSGSSWRQYRN